MADTKSRERQLELREVTDILKIMQEQVKSMALMGKETKLITSGFQDIAKNLEIAAKRAQTASRESQRDLDIQLLKKKIAEEYSNITEKQLYTARLAHIAEANMVRIGESDKVKEIEAALKQKKHWDERMDALESAKDLITKQQEEQKQFEADNNNWALAYLQPLQMLQKYVRRIPGMKEVLKLDPKNLRDMKKSILEQLEGATSISEKVAVIVKGYKNWIKSLNIVRVGLYAVLGLIIATVARFVQLDKMTRTIRDETGFTGDNMKFLAEQSASLNLEFQKWGIGLKESAKISTGLVNTFGSLLAITEKDVKVVAMFSKIIGVSGEEAANLYKIISDISSGNAEMAASLIVSTKEWAKQRKVAPQAVFKDMAENAEFIAKYTKDGGENIAKAAIEARKMGMNLSVAAKIADGLLDFETSIRNQLEAGFFVGRNINLDRARYLQVIGDELGLQQEIVKVMGSREEFENMNVFGRMKLAKALNITVAELLHMLTVQEKLKVSADDTLSTYERIKGGGLEGLETVLGDDVRTDLEFFVDSLKNLGISLASILVPIIKSLSPLLKAFGIAINVIAGGFQILATGVETVVKGVGWLKDLLFPVEKGFKSSGKQIAFFTDLIGLATIAIAAFWLVSNPVGWVIAIAGAIGLVTKYWTDIMDFFKYIGNKITEFYDYIVGKIMGIVQLPGKAIKAIFGNTEIETPTPTSVVPVEMDNKKMSSDVKSIVNSVKPKTSTETSKVGSNTSDVVNKLDELIDLMAEPTIINMDGREVGKQIAKRLPRRGGA